MEHDGTEVCICLVRGGCLREVRQRRMVTLKDITAVSGYSPQYLSGVERGDGDGCAGPEVIRAYEEAIGVQLEVEIFVIIQHTLFNLLAELATLSRLYEARAEGVL